MDSENKFLSFSDFINKYGINTNFLTYQGVVSAAKSFVKQNLSVNSEQTSTQLNSKTDLITMTVKSIRQFFAKIDFLHPTSKSRILQEGIDLSDLKTVYSLFQFKIVHNILPLKNYLYKVGITENDICPFCTDSERHTCKHFFFYCKRAKAFWSNFKSWWSDQISSTPEINLNSALILYGHLTNIKTSLLLKYIKAWVSNFSKWPPQFKGG